jgi:hypothetical protein
MNSNIIKVIKYIAGVWKDTEEPYTTPIGLSYPTINFFMAPLPPTNYNVINPLF